MVTCFVRAGIGNLARILGLCLMFIFAKSGMVYAGEYSAGDVGLGFGGHPERSAEPGSLAELLAERETIIGTNAREVLLVETEPEQGEGGGEQIPPAEDLGGDDLFIIEESEGEADARTGNRAWEYMTKHFGGELVGSYAGIGDTDNGRSGLQGRLRYQEDWSWGGAAVEAIAYYSGVELTLGRGENANQDSFTQTFETSDLVLREAYLRADPFEWWRLTVGRQVVTIGQFDIFSPVDFVLPVDFTNTRLSYNKVEYRLPQDALRNNFYFGGNWRIETVWFPTLLTDDLTSLVQSAPQQYYDPTQNRDVTVERTFPADENQYLLRLMYEGNDLTYGFTFYDGYNLFVFGGTSSFLREGLGPNRLAEEAGEPDTVPWQYRDIRPNLQRRRAYGFELAKQIKKFSVKFEILTERSTQNLDLIANPVAELNSVQRQYADFIRDENGGRLYVEGDQIIAALGFDYYGDKNFFNVYLISFENFLSSRGRRAADLAERAYPDETGAPFGSVFPAFNIGGLYGERKQHTVGLISGFLSFAIGGSLYYLNDYYESLQYGVSLEAFQYLSNFVNAQRAANEDDESFARGDDEENIQQQNAFSVGLRVGFEYNF